MAGIFGNNKAASQAAVANTPATPIVEKVDDNGRVLSMRMIEPVAIPDMSTVTEVSDALGNNPVMVNLRDHPEFAGMKLVVGRATFTNGLIDGRVTDFVIIEGFIMPPSQKQPTDENRILLSTGAGNVYTRCAQAFTANLFPFAGLLRHAGRAWFLD